MPVMYSRRIPYRTDQIGKVLGQQLSHDRLPKGLHGLLFPSNCTPRQPVRLEDITAVVFNLVTCWTSRDNG